VFEHATRLLDRFETPPPGPIRVTIVPPDASRPLLARCPACSRPVLFGKLQAGDWVTGKCGHCRIVIRVDAASQSD
jgi:hypothetical protein